LIGDARLFAWPLVGAILIVCENLEKEGEQMTIEIRKPELEALIMSRLRSGEFQSVEDFLMHALEASSLQAGNDAEPRSERSARMGAELVAVMQESPSKEISLEPARSPMPVRDVDF
jgi:hypothetical protein